MASQDLRKRLAFFLIFATILILVLVTLPFVVSWLQDHVLPGLGLELTVDGIPIPREGANPEKMAYTYVYLGLNLFRILRIILWMALVISSVRLLTYLIFGTAFRNAAQAEALSLLNTVLSVSPVYRRVFRHFPISISEGRIGFAFYRLGDPRYRRRSCAAGYPRQSFCGYCASSRSAVPGGRCRADHKPRKRRSRERLVARRENSHISKQDPGHQQRRFR